MTTIAARWHSGARVPGTTPGQTELDPREVNGWDIHVLRGSTSLPLRPLLLLEEDNGTLTRADAALPADVRSITFEPRFVGGRSGTVVADHGASIETLTGEVTAVAPPAAPAPRLRSFLVDARVILNVPGGGIRLLTPLPLRFHIHESVTEIWLTPSTLTIAGDADGQRFTVLARFDDDTVGDITHLAGAPPAPGQPPTPGFTWASSDNVCAQPDARGGLAGVFGLFACTSTITATLRQPGWPTLSATAEVRVVEDWANQPADRRELHLLSGPGPTAVAAVPNVLFLPDGFLDTKADRDDFFALAGLAVERLNRSFSTEPFGSFEGAINYWCAFVPSRERGTSTLDDLVEETTLFETAPVPLPAPALPAPAPPVTTLAVDGEHAVGAATINFKHTPLAAGQLPAGVHVTISGHPTVYTTLNAVAPAGNALRGVRLSPKLVSAAHDGTAVTVLGRRGAVPRGVTPALNAAGWSIENLIDAVGLPVPAEGLAHRSTAAELQAKVGDWTTLYGVARIPAAVLNGNHVLFDSWALGLAFTGARELRLSDHRLADEKDTAFGLATGERPRAEVIQREQVITWHRLRTQRSHIDPYLATLEFQGTVLGGTWVAHAPAGPGKDFGLVFILARGAPYSGANRPAGPEPIIAMGLVDDMNVRVVYGPGRSMQIASHPLPRDAANAPRVTGFVHATIAHEAAHSFHILDEYGGGTAALDGRAVRRSLLGGNVTTAQEALVAGSLVGERLRWRWPRILYAAAIAGPPVPVAGQAGQFTIRLDPGPSFKLVSNLFAAGDDVFLRQRPLVRPPAGNPPVFTQGLESVPLRVVTRVSVVELVVSVLQGVLDPNDFAAVGPNSAVIFRPVAASAVAAAANDRYAELMPQFIRAHLTASGGPLNAPAATPRRPCAPVPGTLGNEAQAATNLPPPAPLPNGQFPAIRSRIIGAYEGGLELECGVFHPAGSCIMRSPLATANETAITGDHLGDVHGFCQVCRYLLADHIDPRMHFLVDALYHDYPQP